MRNPLEDDSRWTLMGDLAPGSKIAIEKDGVLYQDTISDVRWSSPEPAVWPHLTAGKRLLRRLTPARWRKPLQPIRAAKLAEVTIRTPMQRYADLLDNVATTVAQLTAVPVKVSWWRRLLRAVGLGG